MLARKTGGNMESLEIMIASVAHTRVKRCVTEMKSGDPLQATDLSTLSRLAEPINIALKEYQLPSATRLLRTLGRSPDLRVALILSEVS